MDRKEIARKIREAIFDRIEDDKAIHASSLDEEIEKGLAMAYSDISMHPAYVYSPGRGASAPIPETHTLIVAELPSCTHSHVSWTNDGIPRVGRTP